MSKGTGLRTADDTTQYGGNDVCGALGAYLVLPDLCTVVALSVLILVGQLLAVVLLLAGSEFSWMRFALLSLFVQWVSLPSAGALCMLRRHLARLSLPAGALLAVGIVVAVTLLVGLAGDRLLAGDRRATAIDWRSILAQAGIAAILAALALRYFHVQQQLRLREQAELQARIQALQSRIRPHFLFNSMNIIASLIETDPANAEAVVEDLAELFRASLSEAGHAVPLADELALCERYLRIEKLRLGERLRIDWQIEPLPSELRIPLLSIQPLLENAIYHGIQPLPEGGTVTVRVGRGDGEIRIEIRNPLAPEAETGGSRMALANVRSRLVALYGNSARLETGPAGAEYRTLLAYPWPARIGAMHSGRAAGQP
jgi:two-component system sensor histidine kinase AlgZ